MELTYKRSPTPSPTTPPPLDDDDDDDDGDGDGDDAFASVDGVVSPADSPVQDAPEDLSIKRPPAPTPLATPTPTPLATPTAAAHHQQQRRPASPLLRLSAWADLQQLERQFHHVAHHHDVDDTNHSSSRDTTPLPDLKNVRSRSFKLVPIPPMKTLAY